MTGQLQEGAGQRLAGRRAQGGIAAAQFLFLGDRRQEPLGHIPLRAGPDARVLLGLAEQTLLFELGQAAIEAVENVLGLLGDVGQLPIGEAGEIRHINLAVVPQGQEGGALAAASFSPFTGSWSALAQAGPGLDRALGRYGTGGGAAAGDAGRSLEHQRVGVGYLGCDAARSCAVPADGSAAGAAAVWDQAAASHPTERLRGGWRLSTANPPVVRRWPRRRAPHPAARPGAPQRSTRPGWPRPPRPEPPGNSRRRD